MYKTALSVLMIRSAGCGTILVTEGGGGVKTRRKERIFPCRCTANDILAMALSVVLPVRPKYRCTGRSGLHPSLSMLSVVKTKHPW